MTYLEKFIAAVNLLLREGAALSLLLGYVVAIGGTQFVKRLETVNLRKWGIRLWLALPLGFLGTFCTLPSTGRIGVEIFLALAVGLTAPAVYSGGVRVLFHYWPWLEPKISAQPVPPKEPDEQI
jgi:hypothetical protein